jgi:hypothetical protein
VVGGEKRKDSGLSVSAVDDAAAPKTRDFAKDATGGAEMMHSIPITAEKEQSVWRRTVMAFSKMGVHRG